MAEHSPGVHITVVTISSTTKGKRTESTQQFPSTVGPLSTPLSNGGALFPQPSRTSQQLKVFDVLMSSSMKHYLGSLVG